MRTFLTARKLHAGSGGSLADDTKEFLAYPILAGAPQ